jgi:hypothetical protein
MELEGRQAAAATAKVKLTLTTLADSQIYLGNCEFRVASRERHNDKTETAVLQTLL